MKKLLLILIILLIGVGCFKLGQVSAIPKSIKEIEKVNQTAQSVLDMIKEGWKPRYTNINGNEQIEWSRPDAQNR